MVGQNVIIPRISNCYQYGDYNAFGSKSLKGGAWVEFSYCSGHILGDARIEGIEGEIYKKLSNFSEENHFIDFKLVTFLKREIQIHHRYIK